MLQIKAKKRLLRFLKYSCALFFPQICYAFEISSIFCLLVYRLRLVKIYFIEINLIDAMTPILKCTNQFQISYWERAYDKHKVKIQKNYLHFFNPLQQNQKKNLFMDKFNNMNVDTDMIRLVLEFLISLFQVLKI